MSNDHAMENTFLFVVLSLDLLLGRSLFAASFLVDGTERSVVINEKTIAFRENIQLFHMSVIVIVVTSSSKYNTYQCIEE